ncbi:SAM-dependent methyltransferase [Streptomyces sp. CA-251387]|uniref:SAM-dependent methyltransferase n=1 Tax=Streptomyces sp. CA-251387 TaxID=3240064 RepID=UPI003D8E39B7
MHDGIDTQHAHSARIYDYIIGGKNHYPADREAGDAMVREWPALPIHMRANRDFMNQAVRYLAEEAGMRQFLEDGVRRGRHARSGGRSRLARVPRDPRPERARRAHRHRDRARPAGRGRRRGDRAAAARAAARGQLPRDVHRYRRVRAGQRLRTLGEAGEFFSGLDLVEPGIVQVHKWRPDGTGTEVIRDEDVAMYGAVARKPS